MGNSYPPDPYSQQSGYDPYQQSPTYQQQPTYQPYNQSAPGTPGSYNPYQQPQTGSGYQQYSQSGSGAYNPASGSQPQIVVNVQQGQSQSQYQMQPMMVAVAQPTNGKATASMILGLCIFLVGALTGIPAVILGHMALKEINASNGAQGGRGQAITGLILGYFSVAGLAFCLFWYFFVILAASSAAVQ